MSLVKSLNLTKDKCNSLSLKFAEKNINLVLLKKI